MRKVAELVVTSSKDRVAGGGKDAKWCSAVQLLAAVQHMQRSAAPHAMCIPHPARNRNTHTHVFLGQKYYMYKPC